MENLDWLIQGFGQAATPIHVRDELAYLSGQRCASYFIPRDAQIEGQCYHFFFAKRPAEHLHKLHDFGRLAAGAGFGPADRRSRLCCA